MSNTLTRPRVIPTDAYVAGRRVWVPGGRDDPPTAAQFHRAMQGIRFPEPHAAD